MPANDSVAELSINSIAVYAIHALFFIAVKEAIVAASLFLDDISNSDESASLWEIYFIVVLGSKTQVAGNGRDFECIVGAVKHELVKSKSIDWRGGVVFFEPAQDNGIRFGIGKAD
ncbi:MAG: hypothetical protein H7Y31_09930 [Chitinophagaceae bacterium]|nr:hypothetical protein [Chitinophagaceae bacterium]